MTVEDLTYWLISKQEKGELKEEDQILIQICPKEGPVAAKFLSETDLDVNDNRLIISIEF